MRGAAYRGKGFKERAGVSGERMIGAARCRQQHNEGLCQAPSTLPLSDPHSRPIERWRCHAWRSVVHKGREGGGPACLPASLPRPHLASIFF